MTSAQEEIRQRVLAAMPPVQPAPIQVEAIESNPQKSTNSVFAIMTAALGCCIVLLSLATFFVMTKKKPAEEMSQEDCPAIVQPEPIKPLPPVAYATKEDLEKAMTSLSHKIDKLGSRVDTHQRRIWLLAVANNENVYIRQQVETRWHGCADARYIVFDEKWKFNRMPETMKMDDKQKERLKDSVETKW
jgi:hypothetical protein